jgi:hypothetical protein
VASGGLRAGWFSEDGRFRAGELKMAGQTQELKIYYGLLDGHHKLVFAQGTQPKLEVNVSLALGRASRLLLVRLPLKLSENSKKKGINERALYSRAFELASRAKLKRFGSRDVVVGKIDDTGAVQPSPRSVVRAALKCLAIKESLRAAVARGEFGGKQAYKDFGTPPNDDPSEIQAFARKVRRGQAQLRKSLLLAYGSRCAITGASSKHVLEAAHIIPHAEAGLNSLQNALLLRADIHILFDRGLIKINPRTLKVDIASSLKNTPYAEFNGHQVTSPKTKKARPAPKFLRRHWKQKSSTSAEF